MEFRILGPLEVRVGERVLPLSGARQRTVLALLLLRAGEVVSSDRLIDELWGERPPPSALDTLQMYVSRLRKVLPEGTVVTEGRGYRLAVAGEQIDAGRFERLAGEGRAALAEGDPEPSARLLREALVSGVARRLRTSPTSRSRRARLRGSRSCACLRSRIASRPISRLGAPPSWSASSRRSLAPIRCASGCAAS